MANVTYCNATRRYTFDHVLKVVSSVSEIPRVRGFLSDQLDKLGYSSKVKMNVCLCLEEAMTNAIEHGNLHGQPAIEVGVTANNKVCILQVVDFGGFTFNPEYFEMLSEVRNWGHGGRGIFLIKCLMDEVYYFFHPGERTAVVMIKNKVSK
ncbi:hypothetical protein AUK22_03750 [bacterium CG2_30_54_10]|nr:MAG: hypothetical protein AUK22_03750 [bacterium CG2_30_54_10]